MHQKCDVSPKSKIADKFVHFALTVSEQVSGLWNWKQTKQHNMLLKKQRKMDEKRYQLQKSSIQMHQLIII